MGKLEVDAVLQMETAPLPGKKAIIALHHLREVSRVLAIGNIGDAD